LALAFAARYPSVPATLVLASAYAGWFGSLTYDVADQRLRQALALSELSADEFVDALLPTMFSAEVSAQVVDEHGAAMRRFHPAGFRALSRASAEDLRPLLSRIVAPALLVYGDADVRAPIEVAERLRAALPRSTLVTLPGIGHCCNTEAPEDFNRAVRDFLRAHASKAL
jgi:pimeloyl-ACP methyl ester carboxylesterase